ncbi:MAG TPA: adenylosuccinate lyase [Bacillota bacterium]|jgi:adenylosuccinate lyase
MIDRYSRPKMKSLWDLSTRYRRMLEVEVLACEAWAELGRIPRSAVEEIKAKARIDVDRILAIEAEVGHDVIAFVSGVAETVGDAGKYLHYGLTSYDVVDTALALLMREAAEILLSDLDRLLAVMARRAREFKDAVMIGRTHGIHAEPITFGLKLAVWYAEMNRNWERLRRARDIVSVGRLSGAVGTFANIDPFVEKYVCDKLQLKPAEASTQVLQRDRHAEYLTTLAIVATSLDKMAAELRTLQRTEIREVEEYFKPGQKGSSAMPHKRNPVGLEQISGLARVMRGYAVPAMENEVLWNERDISNSSVERVILPDATILLDYLLERFTGLLDRLTVYPERMARNLELTGGLVFSQQVLLALIQKGLRREEAYALVQGMAMEAWAGGATFKERVSADETVRRHLSGDEIAACFDHADHLRHLNLIFGRVGL